jgi:anti-sigma factor RsiW
MQENILLCNEFEELLIDYLDGGLDNPTSRAMAAHALRCPLCHALLNAVKETVHACRNAPAPPQPSAELEARILQMTQPETAMCCEEFEELLTDYLDGFLPAAVFHRWERHAVLCPRCTNLPGAVVRSIGACYTFKADELLVPESLHAKILKATLGTTNAAKVKMSAARQIKQALENFLKPIWSPVLTPQFASVAMMLLMAFVILTGIASSDGSISGVYRKGAQLAAQTYEQSANTVENGMREGFNSLSRSGKD